MTDTIFNVETLKRKAKQIKRLRNITHARALDLVAVESGYADWKDLMAQQNRFQRDDKKANDRQPDRDDAYLSAYDQPTYLKTIFRH